MPFDKKYLYKKMYISIQQLSDTCLYKTRDSGSTRSKQAVSTSLFQTY